MAEDSIFSLREIKREYDVPWDLEVALARMAPQALLRDLHRPVTMFTVNETEFERYQRETGCGIEEIRAVRRDFCVDRRVPIAALLHTNRTAAEDFRALRAILRQPWTDAPKFGSQRMPEALARRYFG